MMSLSPNMAPTASSERQGINVQKEAYKAKLLESSGYKFQGSTSRFGLFEAPQPSNVDTSVGRQVLTTRAENYDRQYGSGRWTTVRSEVPTADVIPEQPTQDLHEWQATRHDIYALDPTDPNTQFAPPVSAINERLDQAYPPQQ